MSVLDLLILILLLAWLSGWMLFHAGSLIHLLLIVLVIVIILRLARGQSL